MSDETQFRRVENRERDGQPVIVAVAVRSYDTSVEDLWDAITTPERLKRWFLAVEGDLRLGGRYQLIGNAGGSITRCDRPRALDLTWEMMGGMSWVELRLVPRGNGAQLTLEHIAPKDGPGEEHLKTFGPGAVGIGWDLGLLGLERHVAAPDVTIDPLEFQAWTLSDEGKAYVREAGEAWCRADIDAGEDPGTAKAKTARTIAFYTGE